MEFRGDGDEKESKSLDLSVGEGYKIRNIKQDETRGHKARQNRTRPD
jgi:hypothetical protein